MSGTTLSRSSAPGATTTDRNGRGGEVWAGTTRLARIQLRTGRLGLATAALAIPLLVAATARSIVSLYDTPAEREVYRASVGSSPTAMAFNGRGYDLAGLGGITAYELGFFAVLLLPVLAIHLAVRHTRTEEDLGRAELVTANPVGRLAPLGAAAVVTTTALAVAGLLSWAGLVWAGLSVGGSGRYALALTLYLLGCAASGLLAAQAAAQARTAYGLALGVLAASYLVRAVVDGTGSDAVWLTPMGWFAEVQAFGDWRAWPLVALTALIVVQVVVALQLRIRRDLGGGLVAARPGPAQAGPALSGPTGLTWRIGAGPLLGWVAGAAVWGAAFGMMSREVLDIVETNPEMAAIVGAAGSGGGIEDAVVSLSAATVALMGAAVAVQLVARAAAEESDGRLGLVLSAPIGRLRWWVGLAATVVVQATLVLLVGGLAIGVGTAWSLDDAGQLGRATWATLAYLPSVLLVGALAGLGFAVRPRLSGLGWVVLTWAAVVAMLAETLQLPGWARDVSPLEHTGRVPVDAVDGTALAILAGAAVVVAALAGVRFVRRDLVAG